MQSTAEGPDRGLLLAGAGTAAVVAIAAYAASLQNGLVYDDVNVIVTNDAARDPWAWRTILLTPSWFAAANRTIAYRPFTTWTFALNHAVHALAPLGYHLVNVALHAVASAQVALLAGSFGAPAAVGALAAVLFAVHPIHSEAVANVVGRAELLAAVCGFGALLASRGDGWRASTAAVVGYGLAVLAKENALGLLVVLPLADLVRRDDGDLRRFLGALRGQRGALYAALLAVTAGYLVLRATALGSVVGARDTVTTWQNPLVATDTGPRVLTALAVLAQAVWLLLVPVHLSADYSYRQIPVVETIGEPRALAGVAVALGLVVLGLRWWRVRSRANAFWLAFALASYVVVSNLLIAGGTIFGERLLYLPSAGFCVLVAGAVDAFRQPSARRVAAVVLLATAVAFGVRTVRRVPVWFSDLSLAEATVRDAPESGHAHHLLGTTYSELGWDEQALAAFADAVKIDPRDTGSLYNSGVIFQRQNKPMDALMLFGQVTEIDPAYFPAWINRAAINNTLGSHRPALDAAERAIAIRPDVPNGHVVRAFALRGLGRLDEARKALEEALRLSPGMPEALFGLGATAIDQQDFAGAAKAFQQLVDVAPSLDGYRALVYAYRQAGLEDERARAAATARAKFGDDPLFAP